MPPEHWSRRAFRSAAASIGAPPSRAGEVFCLFHIEGWSYREIAEILRCRPISSASGCNGQAPAAQAVVDVGPAAPKANTLEEGHVNNDGVNDDDLVERSIEALHARTSARPVHRRDAADARGTQDARASGVVQREDTNIKPLHEDLTMTFTQRIAAALMLTSAA